MFESGTREKIQRSIRRSVVIMATPEGSTVMPVRFRTICAKCPLSDSSRCVSPNSTTVPCDTTQIFWKRLAFSMLCVTANTVDFCGFRPGAGSHSQLSSMVITGPFVAGSCADVGSSRATSGRRSSMVRAAAMRCLSPVERDPPFCPRYVSNPCWRFPQSKRASSHARNNSASGIRRCDPATRFSRSVPVRRRVSCSIHAMSRVVSYSEIGVPSRVTEPSLGMYKPASSFIMVLLPHPEAPTMAHVSPCSNVRLYGPMSWV